MEEREAFNRRRFVELAAAAGSAALLPALPARALGTGRSSGSAVAVSQTSGTYDDGTNATPKRVAHKPERVIIIGAGFAGLAAANALRSHGVECVVLEARDRLGGRAHTADLGGIPIDIGCSWIHEPEGNVMSKFAQQVGVNRLPASPENDAATIRFLDDRIGVVPTPVTLGEYVESLKFFDRQDELAQELGLRASFAEGVQRFLDQELLTGDPREQVAFLIRLYGQLESAQDWSVVPLGSQGPRRIPTPPPNHAPYTGDGLGDFPEGGYARLVTALAGGTHVKLNHQVTQITSNARGVRVECKAGRGKHRDSRTFSGSHALVTVPLGVLKAGAIKFHPALHKGKRGAVNRMGFGQFEKVALVFPEPFWTQQGSTHLIHLAADASFAYPLTIDLQRFIGAPALVALNAGPFAQGIAGSTAARDQMMSVLRGAYGNGIPEPTQSLVTNWLNDPFSRGSYSAEVLGTQPDDRTLLARPHGGRILFAGEATNLDGRPSTADGAMSSGIREAKRLLRSPTVTLTTG